MHSSSANLALIQRFLFPRKNRVTLLDMETGQTLCQRATRLALASRVHARTEVSAKAKKQLLI